MNLFTTPSLGLAILAGLSLVTPALAVVNIDYVTVGNAGNAADSSTGSLYGAVAYVYQIAKYEVTNAQYTAFLNAADPSGTNANGIYNTNMGSNIQGGITYTSGSASGAKYTIRTSMGDRPVNYVSWYDAARFTNWLHNGQGSGSTEIGAYTLSGNSGFPSRSVTATVWIPSGNEWYKAAYYDPTPGAGGGDNYWLYPTQSNSIPTVATSNDSGDITNPGANVANYNFGVSLDAQLTTVGSAAANNYFGTADQGGNVWEWNDTVVVAGTTRGLRGGSLFDHESFLRASTPNDIRPSVEGDNIGFRVASVPEPTSILLMMFSGSVMLIRRKR